MRLRWTVPYARIETLYASIAGDGRKLLQILDETVGTCPCGYGACANTLFHGEPRTSILGHLAMKASVPPCLEAIPASPAGDSDGDVERRLQTVIHTGRRVRTRR